MARSVLFSSKTARGNSMRSIAFLCALLLAFICLPSMAQEKAVEPTGGKPVDETKLLLGDLRRLGDPEINKMLPDLYWALKATEGPAADVATGQTQQQKMPDVMSILQNPSVRHEVEMLDEQYEDLQQRRGKIVSSMNQQVLALLHSQGGDPLELREQIGRIRAQVEEATQKALLPFQFERLKQLQYHILMQRLGAVNVLTKEPLASELDITDEQEEELRAAAEEIDSKLAQEIAKLRAEARQELFSHLNKQQQLKLEKILGDSFQYESTKKGVKSPAKTKQPGGLKRKVPGSPKR